MTGTPRSPGAGAVAPRAGDVATQPVIGVVGGTGPRPRDRYVFPATYTNGERDHAQYEAIGESDRMTSKS